MQSPEYGRDNFNDLENRFTYHSAREDQVERYEDIRQKAAVLAFYMTEYAPFSRELSLAITKIEEAVFWCNAAIARHEGND